jgi:hypothetical protein
MSKRRLKNGHTRLYTRGDSAFFVLPVDQYAPVRAEWMAGRAFVDTFGFYGEALTIKLAEVQAVSLNDAEALASGRADKIADEQEEKEREMLDGGAP